MRAKLLIRTELIPFFPLKDVPARNHGSRRIYENKYPIQVDEYMAILTIGLISESGIIIIIIIIIIIVIIIIVTIIINIIIIFKNGLCNKVLLFPRMKTKPRITCNSTNTLQFSNNYPKNMLRDLQCKLHKEGLANIC